MNYNTLFNNFGFKYKIIVTFKYSNLPQLPDPNFLFIHPLQVIKSFSIPWHAKLDNIRRVCNLSVLGSIQRRN